MQYPNWFTLPLVISMVLLWQGCGEGPNSGSGIDGGGIDDAAESMAEADDESAEASVDGGLADRFACPGGEATEHYNCEPILDADAGCVGAPPCSIFDSGSGSVWPLGCQYTGLSPYLGEYPPCLNWSGCDCVIVAECNTMFTEQPAWECMY